MEPFCGLCDREVFARRTSASNTAHPHRTKQLGRRIAMEGCVEGFDIILGKSSVSYPNIGPDLCTYQFGYIR